MNFLKNTHALSLCFFLAIGLYSCYTDIKNRRIKNWFIGWGMLVGISLHLFFSSWAASQKIFFLNIGIAILIALILWRINIWAAGDSKFFIFTAILIFPFSAYNIFKNLPYGIPVILIVLINAFILALVYLFLEAIVVFFQELNQHRQRKNLSRILSSFLVRFKKPDFALSQLKILFFYLATLIFFSALGRYIYKIIPFGRENYPIFYLILVFIYPVISKFLKKLKIIYLGLILLSLVLLFASDIVSILKYASKFFVLLAVMRILINWSIQKGQSKTIQVEEIKPNILLTKEEIENLPSEWQPRVRFFSDGLTKEDAQQLKLLFQAINREKVNIYNTFPFVPFIVIGVIITCLLQGKLINIWFFL